MKIGIGKIREYWKAPLFKNSYYLMANSVVGCALSFLFWIIVARYYDASDVGLAVALISAAGIVTSISRLGLDASVVRYLGKEKDKTGFINTCLTLVGIATFIIAIIFLFGIDLWAEKLEFVKESWLYIGAFVVFTTLFGLLPIVANIFVALRDTKYAFLQNTIFATFRMPLPVILAPTFAIFGIFGAWGIGLSVAILISLFVFLRRPVPSYVPYPTFKKETAKQIFHFSAGNYIVSLFATAPALVLPLIILHILTPEENAYYFMAFALASLIFVIPGAFSTSLFAEGSFREEDFTRNLKKSMKHAYALLIPAIAFAVIFGKYFLLLFGKNYSASGHLLLSLLAVSGVFVGINSFYITYLRIRMKIKELILITAGITAGIIGISLILITNTKTSILGVGLAYLVAQGFFSGYVGSRLLLERKKWRK